MAYVVTPTIGVDMLDASLPTIPKFADGTRFTCNLGVEIIYGSCAASTTITAGDLVNLGASGSVQVTTARTGAGGDKGQHTLAVALVNMTAGTWGWFQTKGAASINCAASVSAGEPLYTTATAGQVSGTATSSNLILGIQLRTANGGTPGLATAILSNPVLARGTMGA